MLCGSTCEHNRRFTNTPIDYPSLPHLHDPSCSFSSRRSEDRVVRSTLKPSMSIRVMRAWSIMPRCTKRSSAIPQQNHSTKAIDFLRTIITHELCENRTRPLHCFDAQQPSDHIYHPRMVGRTNALRLTDVGRLRGRRVG